MKKLFNIVFFIIMMLFLPFSKQVHAYDFSGENTGIETGRGALCSSGYCFYNSEYGIRISVVDKNGNQRGNAIDVFVANTGKTKKSVTNYSRFSNKTISVNYPINYNKLGLSKLDLSNLVILQPSDNNFSTTVDDVITGKKWESYSKDFNKIKQSVGLTSFNIDDYLIIEPIGIISNNGTTFYYGTAKDLVTYINNVSGDSNPGTKALIYQRFGNSIFSKNTFTLGINKIGSNSPNLLYSKNSYNSNLYTNYPTNHDLWGQYAYGVAIYKIDGLINQCKIGVNNNSEVKYNWIKYNSDDKKYEPVKEGCCYNYSKYGISEDEVLKAYPQCFEDPTKYCLGNNKKEPGKCSLNRTSTSVDNKPSSDLTSCLTSNKYYGGVIDSDKRILYGCYYFDELSLPGYYQNELWVGSHFIWPTDDTLLQVSPVNLVYNLSRKSVAECYAYTIDESSGLSNPYDSKSISISKSIIERVRNKIKDNGIITLKQNNIVSGVLNYSELNSKFTTLDNGYFRVEIDATYRQNSSHEDAYRYYDNEHLKYLTNAQVNKLNQSKRKNLYRYPYMFLPVDKDFDVKNKYTYGIDYATEFSDIKLSGSYSCSNDVDKSGAECVCPTGTENAGLDLSNYYVATNHGECKDVGKKAICANLMDEYCNSKNISYKCPNREFDLTECVRNEMANNSLLIASMAYNKCVYENCNCEGNNCDYKKLCPPESDPVEDKIIYRTIFLDDPFPSIESDGRFPGSNWGGKKSLIGGKYTGLVKKYIIDTKEYMYNDEAMYSITLTPSVIRKIKTYNSVNGYDDFNLECQNGGKCYSEFIHKILPGYEGNIVNGTCGMINSNQSFYNNFDSCRQNSFNN